MMVQESKQRGRPPPRAALVAALALGCLASLVGRAAADDQQRQQDWQELWRDDFGGGELDQSKWQYVLGNGTDYGLPSGWGNGELEYYTSNSDNVRLEGGSLVIQAQQSDPGNPYSVTSGRLSTIDKFSIAPSADFPVVRVEARMQVPAGNALWVSLKLLPQAGASASCFACGTYGAWPASGEIGMMDVQNNMTEEHATLHYGAPFPANTFVTSTVTLDQGSLADAFHTFALEWEAAQMRWYLDGQLFFTARSGGGSPSGWFTVADGAGPNAPFDQPFYLTLNLAVGGPDTQFTSFAPLGDTLAQPKQLKVDYIVVSGLPAGSAGISPSAPPPAKAPAQGQSGPPPWELLFSDEFNGDSLDEGKWNFQVGDGSSYGIHGWSNGELEYYTSNPENVLVGNGVLTLQAKQSDPNNPYSVTSGRINTIDKFSIAPSAQFPTIRIEARIKVPQGSALWPAFWLLPQAGNSGSTSCAGCGLYGLWAASGEIDVMETANGMESVVGTIHYGGQPPKNAQLAGTLRLQSGSLADDYHVFAVEWEWGQMRWYIDDAHYFTAYTGAGSHGGWYTTADGAGPNAPFDQPFYLILNLAVGGPDTTFTNHAPLGDTLAQPKQMFVDWVRVHGLPYALSATS